MDEEISQRFNFTRTGLSADLQAINEESERLYRMTMQGEASSNLSNHAHCCRNFLMVMKREMIKTLLSTSIDRKNIDSLAFSLNQMNVFISRFDEDPENKTTEADILYGGFVAGWMAAGRESFDEQIANSFGQHGRMGGAFKKQAMTAWQEAIRPTVEAVIKETKEDGAPLYSAPKAAEEVRRRWAVKQLDNRMLPIPGTPQVLSSFVRKVAEEVGVALRTDGRSK